MAVPLTLSSVPAQTPYVQYVSGASQTVFPYPFEITQDSDLVCLINGAAQPTDGGYTLSGQGTTGGGNLTFLIGQTAGTIITLYRNISIARITQLAQNGTFFAANFNNEFNRIYLILQQLNQSLLPGGNSAFALMIPNSNTPAPATLLTAAAYANKYLSFDANGNPQPAALTSSGAITTSILAPFLNLAQSAAEVSAGVVPSNLQYPVGYVDRYGTNTTPGTTDMTSAFNSAILVASKMGCSVTWGATAPYRCNSPINATGVRGIVFNDQSSGNYSNNTPSVIIGHTGHGFDIATSTELTFNNITFSNVSGTVPKTCFFSARNAGGAGCGIHRFNNCRLAFNATFSWFFYGYGSEENTFYGCETTNNQAGSGLYSHNATNPSAYTSSFVTIASGAQSNAVHHHYAFGVFNFGNSGSQTETCFVLENAVNFTAHGGIWAVAHGLAYVNVIGNTATLNLTFDSIRGEPLGGGLQPLNGVLVSNTAGVHQSWVFNNVTVDSPGYLLVFNTAQTPSIQNLAMRASTCTSGKVLQAYTMTNSFIETMGDSVVTGTAGGTVGGNIFAGGRDNITLSGTVSPPNIYLNNTLGAVGIDGDSFTAANTACTGALTTSVVWTLRLDPTGKKVALSLPATTGTTSAASSFTYGVVIPAAYRPGANIRKVIETVDNGTNFIGIATVVASTGAIVVTKDAASDNFNNSTTGGIPSQVILEWLVGV